MKKVPLQNTLHDYPNETHFSSITQSLYTKFLTFVEEICPQGRICKIGVDFWHPILNTNMEY